jgi:hypothetical protein
MRLSQLLSAALVAAALLVPAAPSQAAWGVRIGILVCDIAGGAGFILGSRKALACTFDGIRIRDEYYEGSITKIGIDAGATGGSRMVWAVLAPSWNVGPGALSGWYGGVTAEATPGVGLGANVLLGGWQRSIVLQPLSVQGQVGANIAAGIAGMRLDPYVPVEPVYKR